jgi:hypothetical protein
LKSGSKVKISKNLELSRLLKIKKISLSTVGIFHIYTYINSLTGCVRGWTFRIAFSVAEPATEIFYGGNSAFFSFSLFFALFRRAAQG